MALEARISAWMYLVALRVTQSPSDPALWLAEGYEATPPAGTPVFERVEHTGAEPGRLMRGGR
jgi:hypothetical protein